jgi:hypothetical protein
MNRDISDLLDNWPFNPQNNLRIITIAHDKQVLQVRKPMGLEQYDLEGRPDGQKPFGKESVLAEFLDRQDQYVRAHNSDKGFELSHDDSVLLQEEAVFNYYRYLLLFQLGDMERTVRDTDHNLKICELVAKYCPIEEDRDQLLQYKPYILRINAVARSMIAMKQQLTTVAKEIVQDAITEIKNLPDINNMTFQFEKIRSLNYLKVTLSQFDGSNEDSMHDQLQLELKDALKIEDYERAAELRDKIKEIQKDSD